MKYTSLIIVGCALIVSTNSCSANKPEEQTEAPVTQTAAPDDKGMQVSTMSDSGFVKSADGLDYKIVTKGNGTHAGKPGDFGILHVKFSIGDTVMISTDEMNGGQPVPQLLQAPAMEGDLMTGLMKMKAGDSIVFRMLQDTYFARTRQTKPAWAKPGGYVVWEVKMADVKTKTEMDAEMAAKEGKQKAEDDKILQQYFKTKKITNVKKSPSGLYYVIHTPGAGPNPKAGQKVTVNYTGQTLQGEKFDSNVDPAFSHVEPFTFDLGKHSVIRGWDDGVVLMKKGMKATFYIPSPLAYGERGAGAKIPANAILIFDIELLSFK